MQIKNVLIKLKSLTNNESLVGTITVASGLFVGSIVSYIVQLYLGRKLSVEEYGVFNSLLSISVIIGVLGNTFQTSIVKTVADLKVANKYSTLTQLFWGVNTIAIFAGVVTASLVFTFQAPLAKFLNLTDATVLVGFAISMVFIYLKIAPFAYFQGLLRFRAFAFVNVSTNIARLFAAVLGIWLGYTVGGIYLLIGITSLLTFILYLGLLQKNFSNYEKEPLDSHYSKILKFAWPVFFVQMSMILLNNTDIILVKHYFDGFTAGLYSGLVTVGKVYLFAANTVAVAMYPMIASAFAKKENYFKKLKPFLYLQIGVILIGLTVFTLFPNLIVHIMFGLSYQGAVEYLFKFILFMGLYVMLNFMTMFLLAIERTKVYLLQIPAVIIQTILIMFFHKDLHQVINMNLITSGTLFLAVIGYYIKVNRYELIK